MDGADVFIGLSVAGTLSAELAATMSKGGIVFALANPTPEIMPPDALAAGAAIVGTGRSDFPNMVNNLLAFPGVVRGALHTRAALINEAMKIAAVRAIAACVPEGDLRPDHILPSPLSPATAEAVAEAVAAAARATGVARV
jgi:malate dehydrogenase (oxaloacetate-decarboxylating)